MFRGLLRPGQGFKEFHVFRRKGELTKTGRPRTGEYVPEGTFFGTISQSAPEETEQQKQRGSPVTFTIIQKGGKNRAYANDVLELTEPVQGGGCLTRRFLVKGQPRNPGELNHFIVYKVEEREDLQ